MSVLGVEKAAQELPTDKLDGLVIRLFDYFHDRWDKQIKEDPEAGRLDALSRSY